MVKLYREMQLFWKIVRMSFLRHLRYRAVAFAGLGTNFFFGLLRAAVLTALFGVRPVVEGISVQGAITYTGITQAVIGFLSLFSWYDIMRSVQSGEVATDLLKPMSYFAFWMGQDLGRALLNLLLRGLTLMAAYALLVGITYPRSALQWLALILSLAFSWWLSFAFRFLVNLAAFWVPNAMGVGRMAFTLTWFLSGFMMPLRFFPEWFERVCYWTPFPHMINTIVEIYLGVLDPRQTVLALLAQLAWGAGLVGLGQVVLRQGVKRLVIQGG